MTRSSLALSPRERRYLLPLACGLGIREIAHHFGVSRYSVRNTLRYAYQRNHCSSCHELATKALVSGEISLLELSAAWAAYGRIPSEMELDGYLW
jgi:DNA-binding CsgD family transcriptional regulator